MVILKVKKFVFAVLCSVVTINSFSMQQALNNNNNNNVQSSISRSSADYLPNELWASIISKLLTARDEEALGAQLKSLKALACVDKNLNQLLNAEKEHSIKAISVHFADTAEAREVFANPQKYLNKLLAEIIETSPFHVEKIQSLLEAGADPNMLLKLGQSKIPVLHYVAQRKNVKLVKLLLQYGAHCNVQEATSEGKSVLHRALAHFPWYGEHHKKTYKIVQLLIQHGADVNALDKSNQTPLHYACYRVYSAGELSIEIVKLLLEYGAEQTITQKSKSNETALDIAKKSKNKNLIKLLKLVEAEENKSSKSTSCVVM